MGYEWDRADYVLVVMLVLGALAIGCVIGVACSHKDYISVDMRGSLLEQVRQSQENRYFSIEEVPEENVRLSDDGFYYLKEKK